MYVCRITGEREGAMVPTEMGRRNDMENESFSKDVLREIPEGRK